MEVLQTSALPLGDGADVRLVQVDKIVRRGPPSLGARASADDLRFGLPTVARPRLASQATTLRRSEGWSGKRDSNPRLRPWQGRTLPLSYSRPRRKPSVTHGFWADQGGWAGPARRGPASFTPL